MSPYFNVKLEKTYEIQRFPSKTFLKGQNIKIKNLEQDEMHWQRNLAHRILQRASTLIYNNK
jgi:hypothetical protein